MKKGLFSKLVVTGCILFIIFFTLAILYCFYVHQVEPTIITPLVYSFFGGELVMLFLKKRMDINKEKECNCNNEVEILKANASKTEDNKKILVEDVETKSNKEETI